MFSRFFLFNHHSALARRCRGRRNGRLVVGSRQDDLTRARNTLRQQFSQGFIGIGPGFFSRRALRICLGVLALGELGLQRRHRTGFWRHPGLDRRMLGLRWRVAGTRGGHEQQGAAKDDGRDQGGQFMFTHHASLLWLGFSIEVAAMQHLELWGQQALWSRSARGLPVRIPASRSSRLRNWARMAHWAKANGTASPKPRAMAPPWLERTASTRAAAPQARLMNYRVASRIGAIARQFRAGCQADPKPGQQPVDADSPGIRANPGR